jgi:poly(A) polymerase
MQPRFEKRVGSSPYTLLEQPRFRAGFDFMRLRAQTGEIDVTLAEWWETFSTAYDDERHAMIEEVRQAQLKKPQQPRVRVKRPDADAASADGTVPGKSSSAHRTAPDLVEPSLEGGETAPVKKRRRRRKPANQADPGATEGSSDQPSSDLASSS